MNKIFNITYNRTIADIWLLLLRLSIGGFMLTHGIPKLQTLLAGGEIQFFDFLGIGATASLALAVFGEVICSGLLMLGLATRFASLGLVITMGVAAFIRHNEDPFAKKEQALLYLLVYLTLLVFGPGLYSVDGAISGNSARKTRAARARSNAW